MTLMYKSTRKSDCLISPSEAIIRGIAEDGGLYVPNEIPKLDLSLDELVDFNYKKLAFYIMSKFLKDFTKEELAECIEKAYSHKFEGDEFTPLARKKNMFFLELYHGPTLAFKDMALSILPHLLNTALKKHKITKEVVILTATSGDTGKAALEGFENVEGIKIIVFYPQKGVSEIQRRQMVTQEGDNTYVIGIEGNFDDAQNGVKEIFKDKEYKEFLNNNNYILSSANSINIGRLIPQIVYYFYAYINMLKNKNIENGEEINIVVPTGNFGNILAAYYAKRMGLPVNKLICASNENNVLYDFIRTGVYDSIRNFKITCSPSMDILISSNLERLNYYLCGENEETVADIMKSLSLNGKYKISNAMYEGLSSFYAGFAEDEETRRAIKEVYDVFNYVIDTHTAVAYSVYKKYKEETKDDRKTIIVSTASPFKFTRDVCSSIGIKTDEFDDFQLINELSRKTGLKVPKAIEDLSDRKIIHKKTCRKENMKAVISEYLKV